MSIFLLIKLQDLILNNSGFPGGTSGKGSSCQCRRHKRRRFDPWVGKIPYSRKWQPTPVFLPGESHGQRSLVPLLFPHNTALVQNPITFPLVYAMASL